MKATGRRAARGSPRPGKDATGSRGGEGVLPRGTRALLARALWEDRIHEDRTTSALYPRPHRARAVVTVEAAGVVSGVAVAEEIGRMNRLRVERLCEDGERVRPGRRVLLIEGDLRRILAVERTLLNFLMHLSGVATATRRAVRAAGGGLAAFGTRKTVPGLRHLEKLAIEHGGGHPHRRDLSEGILVKNNHLGSRSIRDAVATLRRTNLDGPPVEVEVRSSAEAIEAVDAGADAVLIDNAGPARARSIVRAARSRARGRPLWIELSGGITPENVRRYRGSGADAASFGSITHSAPALPFHLRLLSARAARRHGARPRRQAR